MFDIQSYRKAESVVQAIALLKENPKAKPLAGGTNALVKLRRGNTAYQHVVDIGDLPELQGISLDAKGGLRIGAGTSFRELIASEAVAASARVLHEAAGSMGGPQLRAQATLGGNLCGGGFCAACLECHYPLCRIGSVSADSAAPLLVLDAAVEIAGSGGTRTVPLADFWLGPGRTVMAQDDVLIAILIPASSLGAGGSAYTKYAMRAAMDAATLGCAGLCRIEGGTFVDLRLACVLAGPIPQRMKEAEAVGIGLPVGIKTLKAVAAAAVHEAKPRASWQISKEFRLHIIKHQIERLLLIITQRAGVA